MRYPKSTEVELLKKLFSKAGINVCPEDLSVQELDDSGMGSLKLSSHHDNQKFGYAAAEIEGTDTDGKPYLATLYLDTEGKPYELDIFKSDFSPTNILS